MTKFCSTKAAHDNTIAPMHAYLGIYLCISFKLAKKVFEKLKWTLSEKC
jgi:hypothetical protein